MSGNVTPALQHHHVYASVNTFVVYCVQYGIKKRDSEANVSSLAVRDDGRKKLSSAGLSGDLQTNQGAYRVLPYLFVVWLLQL